MKEWFFRVVAPSWVAMYIAIFKGFGAWIYVSLMLIYGLWVATVIMIILYGFWGLIFYFILLQSDSFERMMGNFETFLEKRKSKLFVWLKNKLFDKDDQAIISPLLIMTVFLIESPLTGVLMARLAFDKEKAWYGVFWICMGSILEVVTWFLPVYGLGFSTIKGLYVWVTR